MTLANIAFAFLGAALVAIGVLVGALGERLRVDRVRSPAAPKAKQREALVAPPTSNREDAREALTTLGYKPGVAFPAVELAVRKLGKHAAVEDLIREALRQCPKPIAAG